jgi:hypothetical protein
MKSRTIFVTYARRRCNGVDIQFSAPLHPAFVEHARRKKSRKFIVVSWADGQEGLLVYLSINTPQDHC